MEDCLYLENLYLKQESLVSPSELQFRSQLSLEPVDGGALDNQWHFSHFLSNKGVSKPPGENRKNSKCEKSWELAKQNKAIFFQTTKKR